MIALADIAAEVERTTNAIEKVEASACGRYVRLNDGNVAWWQPAEKLLGILRKLPDCNRRLDPGDDANQYSDWCDATAPAGVFGGTCAFFNMAVPKDFVDLDD